MSETGVVSGLYFGPNQPMNWEKDLDKLTAKCPKVDPVEIAGETFACIAKLHATFWNDSSLLESPWVRNNQWVKGEGRERWQDFMKPAKAGKKTD